MRRRLWWRGPWAALPLVLVMLLAFLVQSTPAAATTTDWFRSAASGGATGTICTNSDMTNPANICDNSDATAGTAAVNHACASYNDTYAPITYMDMGGSGGVTAHHIVEVRIKYSVPCGGSGKGLEVSGTGCTTLSIAYGTYGTTSGEARVAMTDSGGGSCGSAGRIKIRLWNDGTTSGTLYLYSVEGYDAAQPANVGISEYCYNMSVGHPSFAWTASCNWTQDFAGSVTWTVATGGTFGIHPYDTSTTAHTTTYTYAPAGPAAGFGPHIDGGSVGFEQRCYPLCQSDSVTMTVLDTTNNKTASYTYLRSADGLVQDESRTPVLDYAHGCYNVSANQCAGALAGPAGTTSVDYKWHCAPGLYELDGPCYSLGQTQAGPRNRTNIVVFSATPYTVSNQAPGAYTATNITTSTTANSRWMLCVTTFVDHTSCADMPLDFASTVAGGVVVGIDPPPADTTRTCDVTHLDGCLANLFAMATYGLADIFGPAIQKLHDLLLSRQPFAFVLRASEGVSAQIARATAATATSSTCSGYSMTLPSPPVVSYTGFSGTQTAQPWPTSVPLPSFAVLACADFEPWGGTTWWQAIRTVMGPAMYLGFAVAQLRKLQPVATVSG